MIAAVLTQIRLMLCAVMRLKCSGDLSGLLSYGTIVICSFHHRLQGCYRRTLRTNHSKMFSLLSTVISSHPNLNFLNLQRFFLIEDNQWGISKWTVLYISPVISVGTPPTCLKERLQILIHSICLFHKTMDHFCSHSNVFSDQFMSSLIKKK